ncbi:MAG TPA: hypothetical protein VHX66_18345 [Solirubrobacteraceae bacterium]|jgi:hypothetical protein|nr:hypothetical protein [Solirubrobacteraceae bacterium]
MPRNTRTRRSKHRGNAAGMIESRGRTGRKPTAGEKGSSSSSSARGSSRSGSATRKTRYDKPPTWKGALIRAVIAAGIVYAISTVVLNKHSSAVGNLILVPVVLVIYMPMIYYTDLFLYRRRLRRKAEAR